jgi:hypothetical protein
VYFRICSVDLHGDYESNPPMRFAPWIPLVASAWACTPPAAVPAKAPEPAAPAARSDWKRVEPAQQKVPLVAEPAGVPPADASCQAYLVHTAEGCSVGVGSEREALARALSTADPLKRDALLTCVESSPAIAPGLIRALRAESAPLSCADVLAMPFLEPRRADLERSVEDTLIALATAGRLSRLVQKAPELSAPFDKPHFAEFFQSTLKPWIVAQAQAIHDLSQPAPRLAPYARGVVAIEAGLADMRFVGVVRKVTLPKEMSDDAEVREAYYAALDEALEPRKARGRDAALVGLRELANEGILRDSRVDSARALLSEVYAGRRIDALDQLLLPELKPLAAASTEQELAARLPTYYANALLAASAVDAGLLRALLERGLPRALVAQLDPAKLDEASQDLVVRAMLERGRRYLRAGDFALAARYSAQAKPTPERALDHALAVALQDGPRDASDLLLRGLQTQVGAAQLSELDQLASEKGNPSAPLAAFDAAYLLSLAPPPNDAKFWDALTQRFEMASRALHDPVQKTRAHELASAAKDTAKALRAAAPSSSVRK